MSAGRGHELLEHTADVAVRGWGNSFAELFSEMAQGLFEVIVDPASVRPRQERAVSVQADAPEELLHAWLDELNALHQLHHEVYAEFEVTFGEGRLTGVARGEPIDTARHDLRVEVKAVTWHGLRLEQARDGFEATVLLDI
jgi:SHS2 domain-containing protein